MFPLSPDVQFPGTVLGIALIAAAFLVAFRRGNGIGRWAVAPMLIAAIMPTITAAQDASPVDFGMLTAAASGERLGATTVRSEVIVNPMFASLVTAAEEAPPIDFDVLTESAKPEPAKKSTQYVEPAVRQPVPMAMVVDYAYPLRANNWTYPGSIRDHVLTGVHAGKLTADQVAKMSDAELVAWHSDDHERKASAPLKIESVVAAALERRKTITHQGTIYYEHSDGVYRAAKQDGCEYAEPSRPVSVPRPAYQQSGCPGGVCPVNRSGVFRWFKRG